MDQLITVLILSSICLSAVNSNEYRLGQTHPKLSSSPRVGFSTSIVHTASKNSPDPEDRYDLNTNPAQQIPKAIRFRPSGILRTMPDHIQSEKTEDDSTDSQSFNVGYSVKFRGHNNDHIVEQNSENIFYDSQKVIPRTKFVPKYKKKIDNGEIITGKRKGNEKVEAPEEALTPQEFVSQALMKQKHLISGIKPKQHQHHEDLTHSTSQLLPSESLINQGNFSPKTQQFIKALEKIKPSQPSIDFVRKQNQYHNWKSIGPGIEIIKSSEIPVNSNQFVINEEVQKVFDHKIATSNSEKFDMSNAVKQQTEHFEDRLSYPQVQSQNNIETQEEKYEEERSESVEDESEYKQALPASYIKHPMIAYVKSPVNLGKGYRIPMDTSLIREPVITTNINDLPKDSRLLPIHFDISPIEHVIKSQQNGVDYLHQGYAHHNDQEYPLAVGSQPVEIKHFHIYPDSRVPPHSSGFTTVENDEMRVSNKYHPQPHVTDSQPLIQEYQPPQLHFKIYGKPQAPKNVKNEISRKPINKYPYSERTRQPRYGGYGGARHEYRSASGNRQRIYY